MNTEKRIRSIQCDLCVCVCVYAYIYMERDFLISDKETKFFLLFLA